MIRQRAPRLIYLSGIFLLMLWAAPTIVRAQIELLPLNIFMNSSERSSKFSVMNQTDQPVESWVEVKYGYPVMDDTGKPYIVYDSTTVGRNDASEWIKVYPQRFLLEERGQQTVRFTVTPPPSVADGEYWARIRVSAKPAKQTKAVLGQDRRAGVIMVSSMDIPFHFRTGKTAVAVTLEHPTLTLTADNKLLFSTDVKKSGNAALWGTLSLRLIDKKNEIALKADKPFVAYQDFRFITHFDAVKIPSGEYTAQIVVATKRTDVAVDKLLQAKNSEEVFTFIVP